MARKVFFSFDFGRDAWRVAKVRNSNVISSLDKTPFYDKAQWEAIKAKGDDAIKAWIDSQLSGTSVTVVLIGHKTSTRRWVKYEIAESIRLGKGLMGVNINKIKDQNQATDEPGANPLPAGYKVHNWNSDNGAENLGIWIEAAAKAAGK